MSRILSALVLVCFMVAVIPFADAGAPPPDPQPTPTPSEPPIVEASDTLVHQLQGAIQPTDPFGYLPTTSDVVVQRGEYALTVPIALPPDPRGPQPNFDVHYSSAGGNGLLGVGASLSGFSEIRHYGQMFAVDGKATPANFSADSRFCLDGQPLVVVHGNYGDFGSEYRVERDGFDKIEYVGTSFFEPGLFTVHTKDGRILRYEAIKVVRAEPQATPPYTLQPTEYVDAVFPLREVSDRAGNRVVYEYKEDTAVAAPEFFALEYYPTSIRYTLAKDDALVFVKRAIQFVYEDRPDPSFSFLAGVRFKNTKRLTAIELYAPNPTAREKVGSYHFSYGQSAATQRSLLTSVTRCDAKDVCQWGKKFVWETSARPDFKLIDAGDPEFTVNEFFGSHDTGLLVYDMDGDGADEVLYRHESEFYFRKKSAAGVPLGDRFYIDPVISAASSPVGFGGIRLDQSRPVDIDGDGDTELFAAQIPEAGYHIFEWNPDAGGVASTGLLFDAPLVQEGNGDPHLGTIAFGDTTGQGLPDIFYQYFLSPKQSRWGIVKNAGGGAFDDGVATDVPAFCARAARVLDRDGDGRAEVWNAGNLACTESIVTAFDAGGKPTIDEQPGLHYDAKRAIFADLNGDGLRDLVHPAAYGAGWVRWNTGVGYGPKEPLINGPEPDGNTTAAMDQGTHVADLNDDSREDILAFRYTPAPGIIAYLSLGNGSFHVLHLNDWPGGFQAQEGFTLTRPGDFNGDGLLDIVKADIDGVMRVLVQKPGVVDVIHEVWDDVVAEHPREVVTYSNAWSDNPKPTTCTYPQQCIRHGMPVVREHKVWQGEDVGAYSTTRYSYEDPRLDVRGRGFLGFGEAHISDVERLSETIITFDNVTQVSKIYPNAVLPKTVTQIMPIWEEKPSDLPTELTARVSRIENTYGLDFHYLLKTHSVARTAWTSKEWEQKVTVERDGIHLSPKERPTVLRERHGTSEFDDYGNVTMSEAETKGGVYQRVDTEYVNADEEKWLIALPRKSSVISAKSKAGPLPEPRVTEFRYDGKGYVQKILVEPSSQDETQKLATTLTRNERAQVTQVTWEAPGEAARHLNIEYDEAEGIFPVHTWNDLGFSQRSLYHPAYGLLVESTDISGVKTRRTYDGFGRPRHVETDGEGGVDFSETPYVEGGWVRGIVESVHSETGSESYTVVNEVGRALENGIRAFNGQWSITATTYNLFGQAVAATRPMLNAISPEKTTLWYDSLNRLVQVMTPDGATSKKEHSFFKTTSWDANSHESYVVRDIDGRVIESTDMLMGKAIPTKYKYGDFDQIEGIVDVDGNETLVGYDQRGRRTSLSDPDRGLVTFGYNGFDEVQWEDNALPQKNALGKAISYERDGLGRVLSKLDVDGQTTFVYDKGQGGLGQLTEATAPDGTKTSFAYDKYGRPLTSTWTIAGNDYSLNTHYGLDGRLHEVEYPEVPGRPGPRFSVEYTYNAYDYLESVKNPWLATPYWQVKERNADGALTKASYGNGIGNKRTYYPLTGELNVNEYGVGGLAFDQQKQTYYPNGDVHERIDLVTNRAESFEYDDLDRLTHWKVTSNQGSRDTGYLYSDIGNLTAVTLNQALTEFNTYGLDGRPHALSTSTSSQSDYVTDELGRVVKGGGRTIAFTAFDLPKKVLPDIGGGPAVTFGYDAFQRRVQKVTKARSTISVGDLYERRENEGVVEHVFFVPGDGGRVAEVHYTEGTQADKTLYLHPDATGSVRTVTDDAGSVLPGRMYYEPFGQRVQEDGSAIPQNYTPAVDSGFIGAHHDDDLGLIDLRGRIYDPVIRRFLTPDPVVGLPLFGQSYNRYAYSLNNPINFSDPGGLDPGPVGCGEKNNCLSVKAPYLGPEPRVLKRGGAVGGAKPKPTGSATSAPKTIAADAQEHPSAVAAIGPPAPGAPSVPSPPTSGAPEYEEFSTIPLDLIGPGGGDWEPEGPLAAESWKENAIVQGVGGVAVGAGLSVVPGGGFADMIGSYTGLLAPGTRAARIGKSLSELAVGGAMLFLGSGGTIGGGVLSATGIGALIGVPAAAVSVTMAVGGAATATGGALNLAQALRTGGSSGPTEMHHTTPRQVRAPRSGKPSKYLKEEVATHPDVVGRPGLPNRWQIPKDLHRRIHPRYNQRFIEELRAIGREKATVKEVLRIRDQLAKEFNLEQYRP